MDGRRRLRCRVAVALLLVGALTGCSGKVEPSTKPTPIATITPTPTPDSTALATAGAMAAYRGFRHAQVAAEAVANAHSPDLAKYAGDAALAQERANLLQLAHAGIVVKGAPVLSPKVTNVALGAARAVTITDCLDVSDWQPVYKATGKSAAAPGQPTRVLATAVARPYGDGWLIQQLTTDRSRPCTSS